MSVSESAGPNGPTVEPDSAGKFSLSEDWLAVAVGLALLALVLTGLIPDGLIP